MDGSSPGATNACGWAWASTTATFDQIRANTYNLGDYREVEQHYGLIPADGLPRRLSANGVLAVGDAGCQATLVVGEGIRISLDAGRLAGKVIAESIENETAANGGLREYDAEFRRRFGRSLAISYSINRRLASFGDREWDEKIELLARIPKSVLPPLLQSEFSVGTVARLVGANPRLWPTLARYASRGARKSLSGKT
jgi:digeranylgeranylglycerophospholipid reductase